VTPTPGSPTSRLLLEYEMHLRNTLAKGMDAESYSLHTFEALLSQSMENLGELARDPRDFTMFLLTLLVDFLLTLFLVVVVAERFVIPFLSLRLIEFLS